MNYRNPQLRTALAEEFVLGTMTGRARRRFQRLMDADPALRGEVEACEQTLYPLVDSLTERKPHARVWASIERRLDEQAEPSRTTAKPGRGGTTPWRAIAMAASAALFAIGLYLAVAPLSTPAAFVVVVTSDADSQASWLISGGEDSALLKVRAVVPQQPPDDKGFQLWVLPHGKDRVQPVGMLPSTGETSLDVDPALIPVLFNAQKFGVSVENPGGSPTGQPTTTPLYHGTPMTL